MAGSVKLVEKLLKHGAKIEAEAHVSQVNVVTIHAAINSKRER